MIAPGEDPRSSALTKAAWRARLRAARRALPAQIRSSEAAALVDRVRTVPGDPVCGYLPTTTEPGEITLLDALVAQGRRVLLPVVTGPAALDWADYRGPDALAAAAHGLREPTGSRLGPDAIALANLILVPALAVDRTGVRLGKGGGHYDRSLPLISPNTPLVAVIRDEELVDRLPAEPHDIRMTAALTPGAGLIPLASGT